MWQVAYWQKSLSLSFEAQNCALGNRFARQVVGHGMLEMDVRKKWCPGAESNHRHADFQSDMGC